KLVVSEPRYQGKCAPRHIEVCGPTYVGAGIAARQIDYTTAMLRIALRNGGDGQVLDHVALAVVHHGAQLVTAVESLFIDEPALGLFDGFARVVKPGIGHHA